MIDISVIIPTYNRCDLVRRALKSVVEQKDVVFEVLLIDDGSTDRTKSMVAAEFPSMTYLTFPPRQGPAAARNRGIENAQGEWIAFLDSDDEWLPGKLKTQLDFFTQHPEYKIGQTEETWIRNGVRVNPMAKHKKYGGWIFDKCLPLCIISPSAVMIHKEIFDTVGLFDESLPACEDYDLWLRIAAKYPVALIEKSYVMKYGGHEDQRSREFPAMDRFRIYALRKIIQSGVLNNEQLTQAKEEMKKKSTIFIQGAKKHGNLKEAEEISQWMAKI